MDGTRAKPDMETFWIETVVHAVCKNCGKGLRRRRTVSGIVGGIEWYHPHNSYKSHNGYECDPKGESK